MGFELFGYGGHPSAEKGPKKGKRTLKARIIQLFKPKCLWVEEMDCSEGLIHSGERKKDLREQQHLDLRRWLKRISEKDSPARFPTVVDGDDGDFSPESRDDYSLDALLRIHEGGSGKRFMVSPLRRSESGKRKKKTVHFRLPIDSIIIYSPDFDLDGENSK